MKRLTLLVCLVAIPIAIFANAHEPYQGDFDLDGDVDFADFLTFASNYGKTGGSTTPSNRVDTVRVTRVDTVHVFVPTKIDSVNSGNPDSLSIPPGLTSLEVRVHSVPTGWRINAYYLDYFGERISTTPDFPKWRNPDKVTVVITLMNLYDSKTDSTYNIEYYRSDNIIFRELSSSLWQYGLAILIPKAEISNIYDFFVGRYTTRVVVEFDGVPYSGESKS